MGNKEETEEEERDPLCGKKKAEQVLVFEISFQSSKSMGRRKKEKLNRVRVSGETI